MDETITCENFLALSPTAIHCFDVRGDEAFGYGHIPNAICVAPERAVEIAASLPTKPIVVYCRDGYISGGVAATLRQAGYCAVALNGGYYAWLNGHLGQLEQTDVCKNVEKSIQKKFHKELFSKFAKAIVEYDMIREGDKIAVCISGGKDSMLMAKLFQELKRHNKFHFELEFLMMDPGYSKPNRELIERNAAMMGIPLTIYETNIFESVFTIPKSPCYICARMRRGHLYHKAQELGCNKIALGHHYDDVIETILMGMLYGGQVQTMMPKLHSTNFAGMELIRPMYLIREKDVKAWRDYNGLSFIQCACKFTETVAAQEGLNQNVSSKRKKVKGIIADLQKQDPEIEQNIFKSVENVQLATVIAYKDKHGERHRFTDDYDQTPCDEE